MQTMEQEIEESIQERSSFLQNHKPMLQNLATEIYNMLKDHPRKKFGFVKEVNVIRTIDTYLANLLLYSYTKAQDNAKLPRQSQVLQYDSEGYVRVAGFLGKVG